jgi:ligand-binding sensor domain-containing protein
MTEDDVLIWMNDDDGELMMVVVAAVGDRIATVMLARCQQKRMWLMLCHVGGFHVTHDA